MSTVVVSKYEYKLCNWPYKKNKKKIPQNYYLYVRVGTYT